MKLLQGVVTGLCAAALVLPVTVGAGSAQAIIKGNTSDSKAQFPWVARIVGTVPKGEATCSGSLVHRSWVISAAHCFPKGTDETTFTVYLDHYDSKKADLPGVARKIDRVEYYADQDLALVHLTSPVDSIDPLSLARPADSVLWRKGKRTTAVGWGWYRYRDGESHNLRWSDHTVVDPSASTYLGMIRTQPAKDSGGQWATFGDSGGPLLSRNTFTGAYTQVGVFSHFIEPKCVKSKCTPIIRNWWGKVGKAKVESWIEKSIPFQDTSVPWNSAAGDLWSSGKTRGVAELTYGHGGCQGIDNDARCTGGTWPTIPGAPYVWAHRLTRDESSVTFTKKFRVTKDQAAAPMLLTAWADDTFTAKLNGAKVLTGEFAKPPTSAGVRLKKGMNTITFVVKSLGDREPMGNPAGLAWRITQQQLT